MIRDFITFFVSLPLALFTLKTIMQPSQTKLGLVFLGILALVFTLVLSPWWIGWVRGQLAQMEQDRRVAASEHVWCYTHMLDTVTGHPPELTREEIIAYNRNPWMTDNSIADTSDRTDCYTSWQEAWDATDPMLQNVFIEFLPAEPTEGDYAEILPLTGEALLLLEMAQQATREAQIAAGDITRQEVEATATAERIERAEGFDEDGMVWCATLVIVPDNNLFQEKEFRVYVSHLPGMTIPDYITHPDLRTAPQYIASASEYQRICQPSYEEALAFLKSQNDALIQQDLRGIKEESNATGVMLEEIGMKAYIITDPAAIEAFDAAFTDHVQPLAVAFEVESDVLDRIYQAAERDIKVRKAVFDSSIKVDIAGCYTLLMTGDETGNWVLMPHEYGLQVQELVEKANQYPDSAGDYTRYQMACLYNHDQLLALKGHALNDSEFIALAGETIIDPELGEKLWKETQGKEPLLINATNREIVTQQFQGQAYPIH